MTLQEAKERIAKKHGKSSWIEAMKDFEFGMGISKYISEEDLMGEVVELHAAAKCRGYVRVLNKIKRLSTYDPNHDNILYNFKAINELVKETLKIKEK